MRAWTLRAEEEYRSAAVFSELLSLLVRLPAPFEVLGAIVGVAGDELRHAELCCSLARRFGANQPCARLDRVRQRVAGLPVDRRRRVLSLLTVEGAIGETVSSALFSGGRHLTREPCTRAALELILRDEVRHARLCWEALRALLPELSDEDLTFLQAEVSRLLGQLEQTQALPALRRLEAGEYLNPALAELGVLPPQRRVESSIGREAYADGARSPRSVTPLVKSPWGRVARRSF